MRYRDDYIETIALIDGEQVAYDLCTHGEKFPAELNQNAFEYIGSGTIYSICGVKQIGEKTFHFWKFAENYEHLRYA